MPKSTDIPQDLREFNSLFSFIAIRHDAARVFDDFLTLVICVLARQTQEDWYHSTIRKYSEDEINIFPKMLGSLFIIYEKARIAGEWTDPLGSFYEAIAGNYKKSGLGQFFTPQSVCDLMAMMTLEKDFGKNINDPCCGSGRLILASHNYAPGNYYVAQDLDHICVKMTCINLAMHGIKAEVYHQNTITMEKPYNSYIINHDYWKTKTPFVYKINEGD